MKGGLGLRRPCEREARDLVSPGVIVHPHQATYVIVTVLREANVDLRPFNMLFGVCQYA
jgi:hypothetical protein